MPTVVCNGVTVNYHDVGSGDTCRSHPLFIEFPPTMAFFVGAVAKQVYRVIAIDMLDWGGTDRLDSNHVENLLVDETNLINEVISGIGESIHLVGHSYGGTIAYHLAMTSPTKIKSLTLIEPMLVWLLDPQKEPKHSR